MSFFDGAFFDGPDFFDTEEPLPPTPVNVQRVKHPRPKKDHELINKLILYLQHKQAFPQLDFTALIEELRCIRGLIPKTTHDTPSIEETNELKELIDLMEKIDLDA